MEHGPGKPTVQFDLASDVSRHRLSLMVKERRDDFAEKIGAPDAPERRRQMVKLAHRVRNELGI
jgi:hypothetical protein